MTRERVINMIDCILGDDMLCDCIEDSTIGCNECRREAADIAINALKKQKTGKWINCKYPLGECSECHAVVDIQNNEANYCPVCGSRNRGEEDGCD